MADIVLVVHELRDEAQGLARQAAAWLRERGHRVRIPKPDAEASGLGELAADPAGIGVGADLAVSIGGDGTMLRTVKLVLCEGVPVLGVNVGRLGYLAQAEAGQLCQALNRFLDGNYGIEERMTLAVTVESPSGTLVPTTHYALNEVVVEKPSSGHTVHLGVGVNGGFFTTYAADGLIVATPTGSTAYSFSARGPIISPTHRALLLTPVSPHMLFDRPLVVGDHEHFRIEVVDSRPAMVTVDGQRVGDLLRGDALECRAAPHDARLVTLGERDFYRVLKTKFGLADR